MSDEYKCDTCYYEDIDIIEYRDGKATFGEPCESCRGTHFDNTEWKWCAKSDANEDECDDDYEEEEYYDYGNYDEHYDTVTHPAHYTSGTIETIDYIRDKLTCEQFIGYCIGNAMKYISRFDKKGKPIEDLKKANVYINWAIERMIEDAETE